MNYKKTKRFILGAELLLLIPLVGVILNKIDWSMFDFIIMSVLLAGLGFAASLITNRARNVKQIVFGVIITALILLTWAELAVGIFGSPIAGS